MLRRAVVLLPSALLASLILPRLGFVPFWDGEIYYRCVERAAHARLDLDRLVCAGHPMQGYGLIHLATQRLAGGGGSVVALHATSLVLGALSAQALYGILRRAFAPGSSRLELALAASLYAVMPAMAANLLHFNPDFGVAALWVIYAYLLLGERTALAAAVGAALVFSKESGFAICALVTAAHLGLRWLFRAGDPPHPTWRRDGVLLAPLAGYLLYLAREGWRAAESPLMLFRGGPLPALSARDVLGIDPLDPVLVEKLADVFVLSFNWLLAGALVAGAVTWSLRRTSGATAPRDGAAQPVLLVLLCFIGILYVVTRIRLWNNVRYLLPVLPALVVLAYAGLRASIESGRARTALLAAALALVYASNFRTLDPVSRAVYGTFRFGEHELLRRAGDGTGRPGRDEIVYNLEFTRLDELLCDALRAVGATRDTTLAGERDSDWHFPGWLDDATACRSGAYRAPTAYRPRYATDLRRLRQLGLPDTVHFLDLPNLEHDHVREELLAEYEPADTRRFERDGYAIEVTTLERKRRP